MDHISSFFASSVSGQVSSTYVFTSITLLVIGAIALLQWSTPDPREPPVLPPKFPLIGHVIGMVKHEVEYYRLLSSRTLSPIFTLKIFGKRIYVINSPELVQGVFRNAKSINFDPISQAATNKVFQTPKDRMEILNRRKPEDKEKYPLVRKMTHTMHSTMAPGKALIQMDTRALDRFATSLHIIDTVDQPLNLFNWIRDNMTLAAAEALYGPVNPFSENHSFIEGLEDFERSIGILFLDILPSLTASKAHHFRHSLSIAFKSYYDRNLDQNASGIVQGRYADLRAGGLDSSDAKNWEVGIMVAGSMNSIPAAFWLICSIFADENLLDEVRAEVAGLATTNDIGRKEVRLDVSNLEKQCPLLWSSWQETLRLRDAAISSRVVDEDTLLNDTYLLKKGSVVQIPTGELHTSEAIWGPTVNTFDARRFLKSNMEKVPREQKKLQKQGFNPWGGGAVLCPGRHFATTEILGITATIVLGYELKMADNSTLKVPDAKKQVMSVAVLQPADGLDVMIKRRKEFEDVFWTYDVVGSGGNTASEL